MNIYIRPIAVAASCVTAAVLSSVVAIAVVINVGNEKLPLATALGLGPATKWNPVTVNVADIPGSYAEKIAFVAKIEPNCDQWDRVVVNGLREATMVATLAEIAQVPAGFFDVADKPLITCLARINMLVAIANRAATEPVTPEDRARIVSLLDQADLCGSRCMKLSALEAASPRRAVTSTVATLEEQIQGAVERVKSVAHDLRS